MIKVLPLLIFSLIILSCKQVNEYRDDAKLCSMLHEMYESDQSIRNLPEMIDPFFEILDSLKIANNISRQEYGQLSKEEQLEWGKIARGIAEKRPKGSKRTRDSLWEIQKNIDRQNTRLLIAITKERGWVSKDGLGCTVYIAPVIIFRHAPEEFWGEIKPLIDKEYAENRMAKGDYQFIDNHLRGRPMPEFNYVDKNEKIQIQSQ